MVHKFKKLPTVLTTADGEKPRATPTAQTKKTQIDSDQCACEVND